jgi:hypothetical protein
VSGGVSLAEPCIIAAIAAAGNEPKASLEFYAFCTEFVELAEQRVCSDPVDFNGYS